MCVCVCGGGGGRGVCMYVCYFRYVCVISGFPDVCDYVNIV